MEKETRLWKAISEAISDGVPDDDGQTLVGDYVTVAEVMVEDGRIGVAVLADDMTARHIALLAEAIAKAADSLEAPDAELAGEGGQSDAE